jgi:RNA polymerase sporulation-specific sigma factor
MSRAVGDLASRASRLKAADEPRRRDLADHELALRFQRGDGRSLETLMARYRRFARARSRGYYLIGGDADDLEQEALIGLFEAIRDFRPERGASFRTFATLCMTRQIITAIRTGTRPKHAPLNRYVSISGERRQPDAPSIDELLPVSADGDPADRIVADDQLQTIRTSMAEMLSGLEVDVLNLYVTGKSYEQIGDQLGRSPKAIDNALQRIKSKLDRYRHTYAA